MKIDLVFLVILGFMVLKTVCNNKTNIKEHMAVTSDMKAAINEIYNADVSAIQNLSDIANKLQAAGGLTIPGPLNITGATSVGGALVVNGNINGATITGVNLATGGSIWCTGTIFAGPKQDIDIVARLLAAENKIKNLEERCDTIQQITNSISSNDTNLFFWKNIIMRPSLIVTADKINIGGFNIMEEEKWHLVFRHNEEPRPFFWISLKLGETSSGIHKG
jgi:hypothetical protein